MMQEISHKTYSYKRRRIEILIKTYYYYESEWNMASFFMSIVSIIMSRRRVQIQFVSEITSCVFRDECNKWLILYLISLQIWINKSV